MLRKIKLIIIIIVLTGCSNNKSSESFTFLALNTTCTITVFDGTNVNIDKIKTLVNEVENLMSSHILNSDVNKINSGDSNPYRPDKKSLEVINRGLYFGAISNGKFDISIGPLVNLWDVGESLSPPKNEEIITLLPLINYKNVLVDNGTVSLKNPNMKLDLGGIAKGYTADILKDYLVSVGVKSAIINLGGNINLIGKKVDDSNWNIGIQHPRKNRGEYVGIVSINNTSLVSSGDYERYFEDNGIRYHHILNSRTGYPVKGEFIASSIIYPISMDSDALSTITFSSSIEEIIELNKTIPFSGIFITEDKKIYISENLLDIFTLTDDSYRLITY